MSNEAIEVFKYYDISPGENGCWPYIGGAWGGRARDKRPYFMADGRRQIAYRWIYELYHGVILTPNQLILHSCDGGGYPIGCGSVHHMRLGTVQENSDDMTGRQRHGLPHNVVRAIRTLLEQGRTQQSIADLYGISRETISAIQNQRVYKHVV